MFSFPGPGLAVCLAGGLSVLCRRVFRAVRRDAFRTPLFRIHRPDDGRKRRLADFPTRWEIFFNPLGNNSQPVGKYFSTRWEFVRDTAKVIQIIENDKKRVHEKTLPVATCDKKRWSFERSSNGVRSIYMPFFILSRPVFHAVHGTFRAVPSDLSGYSVFSSELPCPLAGR